MKSIVIVISILLNLSAIKADYYANCEIEGFEDWYWYDYNIGTIGDDHDGVIDTFKMTNTVELLQVTSTYVDATYDNKNEVLTLKTNEKFKQFEEENESGYDRDSITIKLKFSCTDDESETLTMKLKVKDINNHDPVLDKEVYEYNFGTTIPEDFVLSKFLSISATDFDFTNNDVHFSIETNEYLRIGYNAKRDSKTYSTSVKALKELRAPFTKEFTLVATDVGEPQRNSTARLIVSVTSNGKGGEDGDTLHPPVFSKHLYFAKYTLNGDLQVEEPITIQIGSQSDTVVKQSGYEEYFKIQQDTTSSGLLRVTKVNSVPTHIMEAINPIVIEIEAENPGLHMPGRTALIIRLPIFGQNNEENSSEDKSTQCSNNYTFYDNSVLPLIIYLCVIFIMVVANVAVLAWYFQRRNSHDRVVHVPYARNEEALKYEIKH